MSQVTFPTHQQYIEAWKYCQVVGIGFTYNQDERWIAPDPDGDPEDDQLTMERLQQIAVDNPQ